MLGFSGISETAMNEFTLPWLDIVIKTCRVLVLSVISANTIDVQSLRRASPSVVP